MKRLAITLGIAALVAVPAFAAPQTSGVVEVTDSTKGEVWVSAAGEWHPPMSVPHPLLSRIPVTADRITWIEEMMELHDPHECGFVFLDLNGDGVYEFVTHTPH